MDVIVHFSPKMAGPSGHTRIPLDGAQDAPDFAALFSRFGDGEAEQDEQTADFPMPAGQNGSGDGVDKSERQIATPDNLGAPILSEARDMSIPMPATGPDSPNPLALKSSSEVLRPSVSVRQVEQGMPGQEAPRIEAQAALLRQPSDLQMKTQGADGQPATPSATPFSAQPSADEQDLDVRGAGHPTRPMPFDGGAMDGASPRLAQVDIADPRGAAGQRVDPVDQRRTPIMADLAPVLAGDGIPDRMASSALALSVVSSQQGSRVPSAEVTSVSAAGSTETVRPKPWPGVTVVRAADGQIAGSIGARIAAESHALKDLSAPSSPTVTLASPRAAALTTPPFVPLPSQPGVALPGDAQIPAVAIEGPRDAPRLAAAGPIVPETPGGSLPSGTVPERQDLPAPLKFGSESRGTPRPAGTVDARAALPSPSVSGAVQHDMRIDPVLATRDMPGAKTAPPTYLPHLNQTDIRPQMATPAPVPSGSSATSPTVPEVRLTPDPVPVDPMPSAPQPVASVETLRPAPLATPMTLPPLSPSPLSDAMVPELHAVEDVGPVAAPAATAATPLAPVVGGASALHPIAAQIAPVVLDPSRDPGALIEVALDPPELGRVRLAVSEVGGVMTLTIMAERPETADLMRRHLGVLAEELRQAGLEALNVEISQDGGAQAQSQASAEPSGHATSDADQPPQQPSTAAQPSRETQTNGTLDLRL